MCDERLTAIKGKEETVRAEMNTRRNEAQAKYADTGAVIAERNEARYICRGRLLLTNTDADWTLVDLFNPLVLAPRCAQTEV